MSESGKTLFWCLLLITTLTFYFIEKVLFPTFDILSDTSFAIQMLMVNPDDIDDGWKVKWCPPSTPDCAPHENRHGDESCIIYHGNCTMESVPWKKHAAHVLNAYGQSMFFPIAFSLLSFLPHLYQKHAPVRVKIFEFFLVLFQFYPQYLGMKLMFKVAKDNNPWKNQDGKFSKEEYYKRKDKLEREVGCNEAILESLLQFNIVLIGGRIFLGMLTFAGAGVKCKKFVS